MHVSRALLHYRKCYKKRDDGAARASRKLIYMAISILEDAKIVSLMVNTI